MAGKGARFREIENRKVFLDMHTNFLDARLAEVWRMHGKRNGNERTHDPRGRCANLQTPACLRLNFKIEKEVIVWQEERKRGSNSNRFNRSAPEFKLICRTEMTRLVK